MASDEANAKKKRIYASNAVLYAAFVIGAVVVVNLLSTRVFGRIDTTEYEVYSLSDASKGLVKKLPDFLNAKAFVSRDLPPELANTARYVRDLLDEYATSSNGKFKWQVLEVEGKADKKFEEEATRCKVQKLQIQRVGGQKFEVGEYYLGICLEYAGQTESIPQAVRIEGMEYQLSSMIKKLTTKKRKIAFTNGHGEYDLTQGFQALKEHLENEFEVSTINPSQAEIPADVQTLIVGGPKQAFDEKGQRELDKYLMSGRGAVFLVDGMAMQAPGGMGQQMQQMRIKMAQANEHGLGKLLEAYGFKVGQDFVFDTRVAPGPIEVGGRTMLAELPFYVAAEIVPHKDVIITAGLRDAVFPFPSSVDLVGPLQGGKAARGKLLPLARSSKESWKHTGFFVLSQDAKIEPGKDRAVQGLGYAYEGPLKSAFAPASAPAVSDPNAPASESKKPVRLVVFGDSDFASDEYMQLARFLQYYQAGAQLLVNAISWTVEDETLAPLRLKNMAPRTIPPGSPGTEALVQYGNILGLPLAFCLFGVVRWRIRRSSRNGQKL